MDFRIVHPIPLTVADVVAEFHVLDALGRSQRCGSESPSGFRSAADEGQSGRDLQASLKGDGPTDVVTVLGAARTFDVATDRVQCGREVLDVVIAEVGVFRYFGNRHGISEIRAERRHADRAGLRTAAKGVTSDLVGGYARVARIDARSDKRRTSRSRKAARGLGRHGDASGTYRSGGRPYHLCESTCLIGSWVGRYPRLHEFSKPSDSSASSTR